MTYKIQRLRKNGESLEDYHASVKRDLGGMEWILETRVHKNDEWTLIRLPSLKALKEEALYKFLNGWEVKINSVTSAMMTDCERDI